MGMDLIPVYRDELSEEKYISLTSVVRQNVGVRTARVVQAKAEQVVRAMGQVEYAEPLLGDVTLKVDGWVEELLVDFVGQRVERGQPLFRLYSPDLVSAQQEYLITQQEDAKTRQIRVRLEFTNPDLHIKPGMYADVEILDVG